MEAMLVDEDLREVADGEPGELLVTGPQMALGYWEDEEKTTKAFIVPPGQTRTYYRTGDRVRRAAPDKPLVYLGRVDSQIKVLGHRVELGEVEAIVRRESGISAVIAAGWPLTTGGAGGIEVFLQSASCDTAALTARLAQVLPTYMTPRRIHLVPQFPLNANGKFDRAALVETLKETK
jgi:acyl-CoA synthetase (AMP-forming)/AMP-acid ligase II